MWQRGLGELYPSVLRKRERERAFKLHALCKVKLHICAPAEQCGSHHLTRGRGRSNHNLSRVSCLKPAQTCTSTVRNNPQCTPSVTLPTQTGTTITIDHSRLKVPFGQAGFPQTHGVRRLFISGELVVVTFLHNTNTRVHITLGLSRSFKGTELSHSAPSALSFCIPLGHDCCVNSLLFITCAFPHSIIVPFQLSLWW